jgi:hypothetical protein
MGMFDFMDEQGSGHAHEYKPLTITTNNIPKAYAAASKNMGLKPESLDFKLLKVETLIKVAQDAELEPISNDHVQILRSKELLLNPELKFQQTYKTLFEPKQPHKYRLNMQLEVDKAHSMAKAKVLKSSVFPEGPDLKKWLTYEINKFKIKHSIMLVLFEWNLKKDIEALTTYIAQHGGLDKTIEITLSRWPVPATLTRDDAMIHHYKKKIDQSQKHINHAERDFSNFIKKGTLILEYVKPAEGITGRDFSGHLIEAREPVTSHEPNFTIDNATIETKESKESTKYFARKDGYVVMESGMMLISDDLEMDSISFKSTGHVTADSDKEISINIKGDATQDKIGPNMKVEVSNLSMGGSVAEGAEIRGKNIKIGGQTHLTSSIFTEKAEIKVHKGYLEAHEAKITSVESGKVFADTITADAAIGAELHGRIIHIKELKSHCIIEYSESLTIDNISGEENKFTLTAFAEKKEGEELQATIDRLTQNKEELAKLDKRLKILTDRINQNRKNMELLEENIKEIRSKNQEPNATIMGRFKALTDERNDGDKAKERMGELTGEIETLAKSVEAAQQKLFEARLILKSKWHGYNEIFFHMLSPKQILKYAPRPLYGPEELFIGLDEEKSYEVVRKSLAPQAKKEAEKETRPAEKKEEPAAAPSEPAPEDAPEKAPGEEAAPLPQNSETAKDDLLKPATPDTPETSGE